MSDETVLPPNPADGLVGFKEYASQRPQFFPAASTSAYFLRWQRSALLKAGALLSTTKGDLVRAEVLDAYLIALSRAGKNYQSGELHQQLIQLAGRQSHVEGLSGLDDKALSEAASPTNRTRLFEASTQK